ncbi:lysophospholipid acyltransferase family protein [Candidatus Methylospira mobilis]|nr:lysophospholipid acyltransferase family protein [Candidatus Methylospira mobilis]
MASSAVLVALLMLLAKPLPFSKRYGLAQLWVRFNLWSLAAVCRLKHEVTGLENIPDEAGVILCKHQSAWETLALQTIFPPMVFILKQELLRIPFWGWAMATLEPISIDRSARSAALKQVLKEGNERLRSGKWVVIFPEGTRIAPGQTGKYNASGGLLAARAGCMVVPVAHNAGEFWKRNAFLKLPGTIEVHIGPPLDAGQLSAQEVNGRAKEWIETTMRKISMHHAG